MTSSVRRTLTVGLLTAGVTMSLAPAALAAPVPAPDPNPLPAPGAPLESGAAECSGGEVMVDGNCVPNMAPVAEGGTAANPAEVPLRETQTETTSTSSGLEANAVPNLNGYPCTGDFQSMACIAEGEADVPAVQPRSTLSSSP